MKNIIITLLLFVSFTGISQTKYQKGMQKALDLWAEKKPEAAVSLFEKMAPNNPGVLLNKTEWGIGGAKFFGQSTKPFCEDIHKAIDLFATIKPTEAFYPTGGLARAEQLFKENCKQQ